MGRLIVVSNRTPALDHPAAGGLAVALQEVLRQRQGLWLGWSGELSDAPGPLRTRDTGGFTIAGIDLSEEDHAGYYAGFSNSVLWPTFHLRPDLAQIDPSYFPAYMRVNQQFADALKAVVRPDDLIWVHDYHLIPLGALLRERGIRNRIGFFLHIPFPPREALSVVPAHRELVNSLTAYDVVGLQANRDVAALSEFTSEEDFVRARKSAGPVEPLEDLQAEVFPIGSDPEAFRRLATSQTARRMHDSVVRMTASCPLVLGVDRLDYTKGLPQRFAAYERLLEAYPEHRRNVSFLQIAPPSRAMIPQYKEISDALDSACGRVLGCFAEPDWHPLNYVRRAYGQEELAGLYRAARIGLVTPLRDGMNLVAHEYIGSQDPDNPGVLVLSIFAGAAEIFPQALLVNPYDPDETARALNTALHMSLSERQDRWRALFAAAQRYSIGRWTSAFLDRLANASPTAELSRRSAAG